MSDCKWDYFPIYSLFPIILSNIFEMSLFLFFLDAVSQVSVLHCHRAFLAFFFNLHWLQPSINSRCRCPAGPCRVVCWEGAETQQGFGSRLVSSEQRASGRTSLWTCRKAKAVNPSLVSNQLAESCRQGVVLNSSQKNVIFFTPLFWNLWGLGEKQIQPFL